MALTANHIVLMQVNASLDFTEKFLLPAKGSLVAFSAADTPGMLTVGGNGTILTADSGSTYGFKWDTLANIGGHTQGTDTGTTNSTFTLNVGDSLNTKFKLTASENGTTNGTYEIIAPLVADGTTVSMSLPGVVGGGTIACTANKISDFAAVTSAELAGKVSDETGTGVLVFNTSPTLITPALGTPSSGNLASCTGYTVANLGGLGTGVATFLETPTSANLASAVTGETGSGALVFATSPSLVTPLLGTPTSGNLANCTGYPIANIGNLAAGVAAWLADPTSAKLATAVTDETGSGALVFATSPTFTTSITCGTSFTAFLGATTALGIGNSTSTMTIGNSVTTAQSISIGCGLTASTVTKTINIGTGGDAGSITNVNLGGANGTSVVTIGKDLVVTGDLTVNGNTVTMNTSTITVEDINIILGSGSVADATAEGGGITLKGLTDKTFNWNATPAAWTSSENLNLATGKVYKIAGTTVLTATQVLGVTLGSMASETAANYITKAVLDANTILYATTDNTPAALAVAASRFVGRGSSGDIAALDKTAALSILNIADGATANTVCTVADVDAVTVTEAVKYLSPTIVEGSTKIMKWWKGTAPTASTSTGTAGFMYQDGKFLYICTATNVWKRSPLASVWT